MSQVTRQIALSGLDDPAEEAAEIEAEYLWREELFSACRAVCRDLTYEAAAAALDRRWGPKGRPVSASLLRAALNDVERNNFRAEWLGWFAGRSEDVANLLARRVKPKKTDSELLGDLEAELREELSHKRVEQLLRKARAR
jgi:hypothetical protein